MLRLSESYDAGGNVSDSADRLLPPGREGPSDQHSGGGRIAHAQSAHDHGGPQVASHIDSDLSFTTDDMRTHMTIALDDQLHDRPEMAALFEQKLAIEGASPKPCIVPGNALQLIDDDPAASRSHTPSSVIVIDNNSHVSLNAPREASADSSAGQEAVRPPIPRVRFRSRVRITSGLRRSRHASESAANTHHASASSSASGSPSSSISAPLRWQADENGAWGPLGRRLSAYAHQNGWQKRVPSAPKSQLRNSGTRQQQPEARSKMDERTPLMRPGRHVAYVDTGLDGGGDADDERLEEGEFESSDDEEVERDRALRAAALKREEDAVFGEWPWRFFNRHWWWWHAEPVLCCCCADDTDYEE